MELFVQNTRGGGHPLYVTGANHPAAAGGITVLHFALVDDGDRFKPAMRMLTHTTGAGGRAELGWRSVIQQQERAHFRPQIVVGEQRIHQETVADPVGFRAVVNTEDLFHLELLFQVSRP
ncbi:hypothetical protein D3C72_1375830 [compost metagenome]